MFVGVLQYPCNNDARMPFRHLLNASKQAKIIYNTNAMPTMLIPHSSMEKEKMFIPVPYIRDCHRPHHTAHT